MIAGTIVLLAGSIVILVGSIAEFREALRQRKEHLTENEAADRLLDLRPATILAWVGLAAVTLLSPAMLRDSALPLADAALVIVVLGFAAERASYLVTRRTLPETRSRAVSMAMIAAAVVSGGLAVGLTS